MAESDPNRVHHPDDRDDFRQIKGIGKAIAQALYEARIFYYSDLVAMTPEELSNLLRPRVGFISAQRIEQDDWFSQARELASAKENQRDEEAAPLPEQPQDLTQFADSWVDELLEQEMAETSKEDRAIAEDPPAQNSDSNPGRKPARGSWRELADFFVSFGEKLEAGGPARLQTKVHYSQADQHMEWDGIVTDELVQWMVRQARLPVQRKSPPPARENAREESRAELLEQLDENEAKSEEGLQVLISNLWVSEVNPGGAPRMVRVEASLDITATDAALLLTWPVTSALDLFLINTQTNEEIFYELPLVQLQAESLPYAFQWDFPAPPRGRYQLYLLARLVAPRKTTLLQPGPIVRVEG